MAETFEVKVPNMGDFENVEIIDVLVKPGDTVKVEDPLLTLESDKASMDVPSPKSGTVLKVRVKTGDRVSEGDVILDLELEEAAAGGPADGKEEAPEPGEAPSPRKADEGSEAPAEEKRPEAEAAPRDEGEKPSTPSVEAGPRPSPTAALEVPPSPPKPHASPSVRRFARELGADLGEIDGTGPRGRILKEDVQNHIRKRLSREAAAPSPSSTSPASTPPGAPADIDYSRFGDVEKVALTKINELTATQMSRSWQAAPHVTQHHEADITELEAFRKELRAGKDDFKVTLLPFIMKAVVAAMRRHHRVNASLDPDGKSLVLKRYFNIGVAVDTDEGLVVPVIRGVDAKGAMELAEELAETSQRARARKLKAKDVEGGCFTISNIGGIGGSFFTPIINTPEVAILGVSRASMKPVWKDEGFVPRLLLPLSLSYDHRVIDGALGARFVTTLAELLADPRRMLL